MCCQLVILHHPSNTITKGINDARVNDFLKLRNKSATQQLIKYNLIKQISLLEKREKTLFAQLKLKYSKQHYPEKN